MKKLLTWLIKPFKFIWGIVKRFGTPKGLISLFIAFMIVVGWALIGLVSGNTQWAITGTVVITFWTFFPVSPMWGTIILLTLIFQKYILRDPKALTWADIKAEFLAQFKIKKRIKKELKGEKK
jgi:hypothetical protein